MFFIYLSIQLYILYYILFSDYGLYDIISKDKRER